MTPTLSFCALLAALALAEPPGPEPFATYQELAAKVGRDADAQVRLALWCEARGLEAERIKHLAIAVLTAPDHPLARALLGLVKDGDRWRRPEEIAERVRADQAQSAALAEYNARRETTPDRADAHWKLALWCEQKGLKAEARAHFTAVTRLDPTREAAWKRLGFKKYSNRWMTPEQAAAEKAEAEAQHRADQSWVKKLAALKQKLADRRQGAAAEQELAALSDPRAARAVWTVFVTRAEADQRRAVVLFGQLDGPDATLDLGALAVYSPWPSVRKEATEVLARRDPRDVVGRLIDLIVNPLRYEVRFVNGPGQPGVLYVEGELFNIRRIYDAPLPPLSLRSSEPDTGLGPDPLFATRRVLRTAFQAHTHEPARSETHHASERNAVERRGPENHPGGGPGVHPGAGAASNGGMSTRPAFEGGPGPNFGPGMGRPGDSMLPRFTPFGPGGAAVPGGPMTLTPTPSARPSGRMEADPRREEEDRRRTQEEDRAAAIERNWREARRTAASAEQRLEADLVAVRAYNDAAGVVNDRVLPVLQAVTGRATGPDRPAWWAWWADQRGYAYNRPPKPTFEEHAQDVYRPNFVRVPGISTSCFGAGTPVRTVDGTRPIETLRIGDRVLTQDTRTGALSFQPVLAVFHNPPAPTLKIDLGGEAVVATAIHRFWRAGKGWAMARELKSGDLLRTVGGTARVAGVTEDPVRPVFNLEVAEGHTFFVGGPGVLVHDNGLFRPQGRPFDAAPEFAASRRAVPQPGRPS